MTQDTETWEPIVGFPSYELSNRGRVRSLACGGRTPGGTSRRTPRVVKLQTTPAGRQFFRASLGDGHRPIVYLDSIETGPTPARVFRTEFTEEERMAAAICHLAGVGAEALALAFDTGATVVERWAREREAAIRAAGCIGPNNPVGLSAEAPTESDQDQVAPAADGE